MENHLQILAMAILEKEKHGQLSQETKEKLEDFAVVD